MDKAAIVAHPSAFPLEVLMRAVLEGVVTAEELERSGELDEFIVTALKELEVGKRSREALGLSVEEFILINERRFVEETVHRLRPEVEMRLSKEVERIIDLASHGTITSQSFFRRYLIEDCQSALRVSGDMACFVDLVRECPSGDLVRTMRDRLFKRSVTPDFLCKS